ncbi:hypothetical protein GCM10018790_30790 [Kitasatospora xanthocidica]|nr:hypothetical protein GCM10018790_30790 [Kitasatospora xanthocidica]
MRGCSPGGGNAAARDFRRGTSRAAALRVCGSGMAGLAATADMLNAMRPDFVIVAVPHHPG